MNSRISVTFDSNIWEVIVLPEKLAAHAFEADLKIIKAAIVNGIIEPYISDVIFTLEAIRSKDRARTMQKVKIKTETTEDTTKPNLTVNLNVSADFSHHPGINEPLSKALDAAKEMGFKLIKVDRIGFPQADPHLYKDYKTKPSPPKKSIFQDFDALGLGSIQAEARGDHIKKANPSLANMPSLFVFAQSTGVKDDKLISYLVAEWADGDAVLAHYDYDHKYFCTLDEGKSTPLDSILEVARRPWLLQEYGIRVVSPTELAQKLKPLFSQQA